MNFWWVNQKQTHRHEIGEGYMWSPKRQQDSHKHFSYEYMKHIQPGDIIFSYANAAIVAVGVAKTHWISGDSIPIYDSLEKKGDGGI